MSCTDMVQITAVRSNQTFYYTVLIVLRQNESRVGGALLRVIASARNTAPFEEISQRWRAVGNSGSDLIGFEI